MIVDGRKKEKIDEAVALIKKGEVVAFPTETVYGLGCDAFNEGAIKKVFKIKARPLNDPLILHIASHDQLSEIAEDLPPEGLLLVQKFWPGPLTIILKKTDKVSNLITAGMDTVAVRMPRNIIALALIKNSGKIIAAPSANKFQSISPTTAQAVEKELGKDVFILEGGPSIVGLESTIVSLVGEPTILRMGGIPVENIEEVLGHRINVVKKAEGLAAPGMLDFHYAPKKSVTFVEEVSYFEHKAAKLKDAAILCFSAHERDRLHDMGLENIFVLSIEGDYEEAARNYFRMLREIDESDFKKIFCLSLPPENLGRSINDRLKKAVHK